MLAESQPPRRNNRRSVRSRNAPHCAAIALMLLVPALAGCHSRGYTVVAGGQDTLQLTSSSFQDGSIPRQLHLRWCGSLS